MASPRLTRLGYGAANLGNLHERMDDDEAWTILDAAWECGIRYFDTAPHYGLGLSERRLGAFLATKPRAEFVVSTKVGRLLRAAPGGGSGSDVANGFVVPDDAVRVWDFSASGVRQSLEDSLERLGLDRVDVILLHDPERYDVTRGLDEGLPAAAGLRDEGLVQAVGVGSMVTDTLLRSARSGAVDLLMVAGRLTLVDQEVADQVLPACEEHGVDVVAAAVFNSGLLTKDEPGPDDRYDYEPVPCPVLERSRRIAAVCRDFGVPLPVAALHYPLRHRAVRCVVVGGATPEQVRENARRLDVRVPPVLWRALREQGLVA